MKQLILALATLLITTSSFAFPSLDKEIGCSRVVNTNMDILTVQYVPYANVVFIVLSGGKAKFPGYFYTYVSGNGDRIYTEKKHNDYGQWNATIDSNKSDWNINFTLYNNGKPFIESNIKCEQIG